MDVGCVFYLRLNFLDRVDLSGLFDDSITELR